MNGVLVIDKPRGPTSFDVVRQIREQTGVRRVGHTGTLDPLATGVLPICLGEATKLVPFLIAAEKVYQAEAQLGVVTDTGDAEGKVTATRDARDVEIAEIDEALRGLVGDLDQIPPMHSAVRVGGRRLYELARLGQRVERPSRRVQVHSLARDHYVPDTQRLTFTVRCGKGTYVRTLAEVLGQRLAVGAHLTALRRLRVGPFTIERAVVVRSITASSPLTSLAEALSDLPFVEVNEQSERDVADGKARVVNELKAPPGRFIRLLRSDGSLLAVAEQKDRQLQLVRVFRRLSG